MSDRIKELTDRMIEIRGQIEELTKEQNRICMELAKFKAFDENKVANYKASMRLEGLDAGVVDYE